MWEVHRVLDADHEVRDFSMVITKGQYRRFRRRARNGATQRMTLTVEWIDDRDDGWIG